MNITTRFDPKSIKTAGDNISIKDNAARGVVLTLSIGAFTVLLCLSNYLVSQDVGPIFHIYFDRANLWKAITSVAIVTACAVPLLVVARFSIGYIVSFYFFAITATYVWLSHFTPLQYDHNAARWLATASLIMFCIPAVLIRFDEKPLRTIRLSSHHIDKFAALFLLIAASVFAYAATSHFHVVGAYAGEDIRASINYPALINYAIGISVSATLPFTYAWYVHTSRPVFAIITLVILMSFYAVTLTKVTLLAPFWLLFLTLVSTTFSIRLTVILSLLIPLLVGLIAFVVDPRRPELIFRLINFRMLAIPGSGLDHYYHYFSQHPLTHFCQISIVGKMFSCALPDQLGAVLSKEYHTGNYNASLFATEGIASVGAYFAPAIAFVCGSVIGLFNAVSRGLDVRFILLSAAMLTQTMMNVPLSTTMLTHGGIILFALWQLCPRNIAISDLEKT